jgi:tRNA(Ile)-lysidine synthase
MSGTLSALDAFWQQPATRQLHQQLNQFSPQQRFLVACSGGRDSLALARALQLLCPDRVRIIHINHQLQQPAADWAQWLSAQCQVWQLPHVIKAVDVAAGNLEQEARKARYQAIYDSINMDEVLVLGHHQQDQAETIFLRLMSGSGVVGLAAMQQHEQRQQYNYWRPWLSITRQQVTELATLICPDFINDPANDDARFDRVILRQQVWPILHERWPSFEQGMARSAFLMQDAADILQDVLRIDWQSCVEHDAINIEPLLALSVARQRWLLSKWMQQQEQYAPPLQLVERIKTELIAAKQDAKPKIEWAGWQFRRYQQWLYRLPKVLPQAKNMQVTWALDDVLSVPSGQWRIQPQVNGLPLEVLQQPMMLLARQGGEVLHVQGAIGRRPLKKILQELQLAPWQREQVHLLQINDVIYGVLTAKGFIATVQCAEGAEGWLPSLMSSSVIK